MRDSDYNPLFDSSVDRTPPPLEIPEAPSPVPTDQRRVPRALLAFALGSVLVILLACAAVFLTVQQLTGNIPRVPNVFSGLDNAERPTPVADRVSFLVMGTDSRQGAGQHGDAVLTLARVDVDLDPSATRASVVSIPRDAWVTIPDHGPAKISAAYGIGGPTLLVRTVEGLTHVRIDHFAAIDFAGFRQMVDAVGGIDVQGTHLGGSEALAYVSQGTASPAEYRDRLARQQTAIRALLDRTAADGLLGDPLKLFRLLDALSEAVSVDETLTSSGMDGLALQMRGLRSSTTQFAVSPVRGIGREGGQTVVYLDGARSDQLWNAVRDGTVDGYLKQFPGDSIKAPH